ncbi:T9SS type A sorting domain-containing protein [Winogradskyella sp.]|uniref:T9SS type A sorting domain-containing protein n=1 Tax=Winogradskyella sp. TaxID=1883156 RepID=UPI0026131F21|nr:T9SS type A sorting domain-containing protein [Winogradskyella sp.]
MKKKILSYLMLLLLFNFEVIGQETFKVMFYNLLNYPLEDAVPNREDDLEFILSDYQPDLFLVCELNNSTGANNVLSITKNAINSNFEMASFVPNTSDDLSGNQNDLQNLLYYDSTKFILEEEVIVPTDLRDFNVYKLQLNTIDQDTNPIELYIVVCHLKASNGTANQQRRFDMVVELNNYLNTLPSDANVLLGGDLNLYTASEPAFLLLILNTNNITFADPINRIGSWSNNPNFVDVFTQSTRTQTGFGGTTGGFDDRFDFIMTSENMLSTANITYVDDSYQVYGNNGLFSCWNRAINSSDCEIPGSPFSFEIRDALHNFSDHLPVTLSLEANVTLSLSNEEEITAQIKLEKSIISSELIMYIHSPNYFNQQLSVYNTLGQVVESFQTSSDQIQVFKTSNLGNGIYFIDFSQSNTKPLKFVISR